MLTLEENQVPLRLIKIIGSPQKNAHILTILHMIQSPEDQPQTHELTDPRLKNEKRI